MADLREVRSSDRTAEEGRLFYCTIAKGKMNICIVFVIVCCC